MLHAIAIALLVYCGLYLLLGVLDLVLLVKRTRTREAARALLDLTYTQGGPLDRARVEAIAYAPLEPSWAIALRNAIVLRGALRLRDRLTRATTRRMRPTSGHNDADPRCAMWWGDRAGMDMEAQCPICASTRDLRRITPAHIAQAAANLRKDRS